MKRENNKKFKKRKRNQNRSLTCRVLSMMFAIVLFCSTVLINTSYVSQASSFDDMVDMVEVEEDSAAVDTSEDTGDDLDTDVNFESEEGSAETYSESDDFGSSDADFSSGENMFTDGTSESSGSAPTEEAAQPVSCIVNLKNETIEVKAEAPAGVLPNGTKMSVKAVENNTEDAELTDQYNKLAAKITEQLQNQGKNLDGFLAYNVSFTDADGNPVEPSDKVTYSFTYKEASSPELTDPAASTVTAAMIRTNKETSELELTELKAEEDKLTVETNESRQLTKAAFQSAATAAYTFVWSSTPAADDNENNENKVENGEVNNEGVNTDTNTENTEENGEEAPDQEQIKMIRIIADEVNLRKAPSTEAEVIATVDTDTQLPLLETVTGEDESTWYKVSYEETDAYVRSDMAEVVENEEQDTEVDEDDVEVEEESKDILTFTKIVNDLVEVIATTEAGVIPEDAELIVNPIEQGTDQYAETETKLNEKAGEDGYEIAGFLAYDIYFQDSEGNKIEPVDGSVNVSMHYTEPSVPEEVAQASETENETAVLTEEDELSQEETAVEPANQMAVTMMHLVEDEDGNVNVVDMTQEGTASVETDEVGSVQKAEFVTDKFSVFALAWQDSLDLAETRSTTVTITDDIVNSGALIAEYNSNSVKTYTWYRSSKKTGTYTKVDPVNYNTGSEIKTNISQDQTQLFPAYDNGEATGARQWYKVEVELTDGGKITSDPIQVSYFKELQNGGFETLTTSEASTQFSNKYYKDNEGVWQTTGTNNGKDIEIARQDLGKASTYAWNKVYGRVYNNFYDGTFNEENYTYEDGHDWKKAAFEGAQFAELNCEASGALYQDVLTKDGTALNYWLSHRARGKKDSPYVLERGIPIIKPTTCYPGANVKQYDTMFLVMMPTKTAIDKELTTQTSLKRYLQELGVNYSQTATEEENVEVYNKNGIKILRITSSNQKWHNILATNDYIPTSSLTRFFFMAGTTASGDPTVGNFLDNVGFSQQLPPVADDEYSIEINKNFSGLSSTQINNKKNNLRFEISVTDNATNQPVDDVTVRKLFELAENAPLEISGSSMTSQPNGNLKYTLANKKITHGKSYTVTLTEKNAELSGYQLKTTTETKVKVGDAAEQTTPNTTTFTLTGKTIATISFTNAYEAANKKKVNFTKVWDDNNNTWHTRPDSLTVTLKATYDVEENGEYVTKELTAQDLGLDSLDQILTDANKTDDNKWKCTWEVPVYKILNSNTGLKVEIDYTVVEGNVDSEYVYYTSPSNRKAVSGNGSDYEMKTWNAITTPGSTASADSTGSSSEQGVLSKVKARAVNMFGGDDTPTVVSDSTNTTNTLGEPAHRKYITYNKNTNDYTLNLDVTGAEGVANGVDVLFVIDTSGSMGSGSGSTYTNLLPTVKNLLNGTNSTTGIVDQILNANAKNAVAYVSFAGVDETKTTDWYTAKNSTTFKNKVNNLKAEGGTNWTYAMQKADSVLSNRTNNKKVVIFLSDGKPTFSIDKKGKEYGHGNATEDSYYTEAINAVKNSSNLKTVDQFYSVYLTTGTKSGMETFHNGINPTVKGAAIVDGSGNNLGNALSSIINQVIPTYKDVVITDTLSDYVEFTDNPQITVKMVDANGNETSLSSSDYTISTTSNSVNVKFNNSLVKGATYTVSFHVKPTQKANDEFSSRGNYPNTGEPGTGSTSDGKAGFFSNDSATLTYKVDGTNDSPKTVDYQKPVVQVLQHTLTYTKVWKQPSGVNPTVDSIVLNVNYSDGTSGTVILNKTNEWTATENVPVTKTIESVTEETPVADYTASYSYPSSTEAVVTNNYSKVTTNKVKVKKIWKNDGPKETVTVALMQSEVDSQGNIGEAKELYTEDLTELNKWSCEWKGLVTDSSDATTTKHYVYGVVEKNIPAGYQSNIEYDFKTDPDATNVKITNTYDENCADENYYIANVLQTEQLNIRKEWDDNNNVAELRPDTLNVTVAGMNFTLNKNQNWETSATVLKKTAIEENQVTENNVENYTYTGKEITREDSATQVVFHNQLISKNITVRKIWHDNITDHSNDYVEFKLEGTKDRGVTWKEFGTYKITENTTGDAEWTRVIKNLPTGYEYRVTETGCSNQNNYVSAVTNSGDTFTITNTLKWSAVKTSADDNVGLSDAEFELKNTDNTLIATGKSGDGGAIEWTPEDNNDLFTLHGDYTIHETKAPVGYMKNETDWTLHFDDNGLLTQLDNVSVKGTAKDGVVITLTNQKLYTLPSTGGNGIYWYMIGGMVLMSTAAWILYKNKCREVLGK